MRLYYYLFMKLDKVKRTRQNMPFEVLAANDIEIPLVDNEPVVISSGVLLELVQLCFIVGRVHQQP